MPTTKAHRTRHHSNLRPKHTADKKFLNVYWPYLPLFVSLLMLLAIMLPWQRAKRSDVLPYATQMSIHALLDATNKQRSSNKKSSLALSSTLSKAAQAKAEDMVKRDYWSHNTPDGKAPWTFINKAGYSYQKAGENLAYGFLTSSQVVTGWMNSASHRANVLESTYRDVGFGFADSKDFDDNGPATIVVAMYGTPFGAAVSQPQASQARGSTATEPSTQPVLEEPAQKPGKKGTQTVNSFAFSNNPQNISKVQTLTNGVAPWAQYVVGAILGAAVTYLLIKHAVGLKRAIRKGEKFIIQHPLLDTTLIVLAIACTLLVRRAGVIL